VSCHNLDGKPGGTGPSWRETNALWREKKERVFTDGSKQLIDENYIRESMLNPGAHIVETYSNAMPTVKGQLDDRKILAMILAIKNLHHFDDHGTLKAGEAIDWQMPAEFPGASPAGAPGAGAVVSEPAGAATMPSTPNPSPGPASGNK
jgi:hypothetical protein